MIRDLEVCYFLQKVPLCHKLRNLFTSDLIFCEFAERGRQNSTLNRKFDETVGASVETVLASVADNLIYEKNKGGEFAENSMFWRAT